MNVSLRDKLWALTVCVLVSIIVGMAAGFLVYGPGHVRAALLTGGGAFGGCMIMCLTAAAFLFRTDDGS